ncbi:hypothetical protein [Methylobacter psychrophilus]|uniref:hypothetical protein n=1 Tax=Methylobacter psychrophilus TaxID=96941 RepID=UPI0021D4A80A|nr:hypothetical protein [Methylobacter psychrophilus]
MAKDNYPLQGFERPAPKIYTPFYSILIPKDFYKLTTVLIMVAAFICACIRAWLLSMTHDEAVTLSWHVSGSVSQIFLFKTHQGLLPDNNHLLHTLLVKLSTSIFGENELCIRLPSLFGYSLYLSACYLLLMLVAKKSLIILGALLLAFHPYLMDFFSIARGYSLGLGFMMMGLYFLLSGYGKSVNLTRSKTAILSTLMFALAVTANLSFLLPYFSCLIICFLIESNLRIRCRTDSTSLLGLLRDLTKDFSLFFIPSISFLLLTCTIPIRKINAQKLFAIGGTDGFSVNTIGSIIKKTIYGKMYLFDSPKYGYWLIVLALSLTIYTGLRQRKNAVSSHYYPQIFLGFIIISSVISIIQHHVLGIAYLTDRRAIFFIPLLLLLLISLPGQMETIKRSWLLILPVYFSGFVLALHFLLCVNFKYYLDWQYEASTKEAMALLKTQSSNLANTSTKITLGIDWFFEPSINYYIKYWKMDWIKPPANRSGSDGFHDYYYEHDKNTNIIEKYRLQVLIKYPLSATYLADNRK